MPDNWKQYKWGGAYPSVQQQFYENHGQLYMGVGKQVPIKKAVKVETTKELKKKLKAAEEQEREQRKADKRVKAYNKEQQRLRKVALDALERVASDSKKGYASVQAAEALLRS